MSEVVVLRNRFKTFTSGVHRQVPPAKTRRWALNRVRDIKPGILDSVLRVKTPSGIPQTRFVGSPEYRRVVLSEGANGKGHSWDQAYASGIMEFAERYSCLRYLNSSGSCFLSGLGKSAASVDISYDLYANFMAGKYSHIPIDRELADFKVRWYRAYDLNGRESFFPLQLLGYMLLGSNGMASGNSLEEAVFHGICEVVERHCITVIQDGRKALADLDQNTIRCAIARRLIGDFTKLGQKVHIKDLSLDTGLPVVGVIRPVDRSNCVVTAGVASSRDEALIRALTENSQIEHPSNYTVMRDVPYYFAGAGKVSFLSVPEIQNANIRAEIETASERLAVLGMKVFYFDATDPVLNIPSVMVYIRGAKWHEPNIPERNLYMGLIEESIKIGRYKDSSRLIDLARSRDCANALIYDYCEGVLRLRTGDYYRCREFMARVSDNIRHTAFKKYSLAILAICEYCLFSRGDLEKTLIHVERLYDLDAYFRLDVLDAYHYLCERGTKRVRDRLGRLLALFSRFRVYSMSRKGVALVPCG